MNIGIDIRLLGSKHGGIGRYTLEIVKNILALDDNNHYTLFYNDDCLEEVKTLQGHIFTWPRKNVTAFIPINIRHYSVAEQVRLPRILNTCNLDLMHFPNFNVPILYKKPFVVTIHDVVHHKIGGAKKSHLLHFYAYKKVIDNAVNDSKKIITVSEYSKKEILTFFKTAPEKICCIYEGSSLSADVLEKEIEIIKKRYLINKPYFLFVGVLERKKNLVNLTRGFDEFIKEHNLDMDLVIVGKIDKHYPEIKHHALDIKNSDRLVFTGQVEEMELRALYKGAYAYVSASLHEGFGLPGVEAMRFGLPLVVSNTPVFNEIYENAAIYFDPLDVKDIAEKLHLIARDELFYKQLQLKSLERAKLFSWEKAARETIQVYNRAIN